MIIFNKHTINYKSNKNLIILRTSILCFFLSLKYDIYYCQNLSAYIDGKNKELDTMAMFKSSKIALKYLSFLPNISYSYNNGLAIGFSISPYISYFQNKKRYKLERQRYLFGKKNQLNNDVINIKQKYKEIGIDLEVISLKIDNLKGYYDNVMISKKSFENHQILLSKWLSFKYSYFEKWIVIYRVMLLIENKFQTLNALYFAAPAYLSLKIENEKKQILKIKI